MRHSYERVPRGKNQMRVLGIFGNTVADDLSSLAKDKRGNNQQLMKSRTMGSGMAGGMNAAAPATARAFLSEAAELNNDQASDADALEGAAAGTEQQAPQGGYIEPTVRKNFADTALWVGTVSTDKEGFAEIEFEMPENLTTWKINVWAMGHGTNVGEGHTEVITRKDLIVRLQAPRFFTETDEVVISANVHNYLDSKKTVTTKLLVDGEYLISLDDAEREVVVDANGETRVDWVVKVHGEGETTIQIQALTDEESDAVEMSFPVYVHGILNT